MVLDFNFSLAEKSDSALDSNKLYDILIIGAGPAGLNAAIYSKRKGSEVGIITKNIGGQIVDTSVIENYLGYSSISGEELVNKFDEHVRGLGVPIATESTVESVKAYEDTNIKEVFLTDGRSYKAKALIIATGSIPRKLDVPGEADLLGKGVAYCAICDGPLYAGLDVVVAGGGNTAIEAAIDLSRTSKSVTVVHRSQLRADQILIDRIGKLDNVDIKLETQIKQILGDDSASGVEVLDKTTDKIYTIPAKGIFVEIGYLPNNDAFKDLVDLNEKGEIIVDKAGRTNIEGIFAAGDSTNSMHKQVILSAADGAKCALSAYEYLNTL